VQRNRVPGKNELLGLQALADTNARIIRTLDGEIEQLRRSYDTIHSRFIEAGDALVALARKPAEISACIRVQMRENNKERLSATTLASADGY